MHVDDPDFDTDGATLHRGAATKHVRTILDIIGTPACDRPGTRLGHAPALRALLAADGAIGALAAIRLGPRARPVRAVCFDKTQAANWSLGWHQDRTICVAERIDTPGFGPWTIKQGQVHAAPPYALLAQMVTLRVHLDPVSPDNAPLLIARGSHRLGAIYVDAINATVAACEEFACLAEAGDVWAYATPILHASKRSISPARRRVLQVDFAAIDLPGGLAWAGV